MTSMQPEPVCEPPRLIEAWRARKSEPVTILRCAGDGGRCGRVIGDVFTSPAGHLLRTFAHMPRRAMPLTPESVEVARQYPDQVQDTLGEHEHYVDGESVVRSGGQRDESGQLGLLDGNYGWHGAHAMCDRGHSHERIDRVAVMNAVRRGTDRLKMTPTK